MNYKEINTNTVNSSNFNDTMRGYVDYALDHFKEVLTDKEYEDEYGKYTGEQINQLQRLLKYGIEWGKNDMTMDDARHYRRRR